MAILYGSLWVQTVVSPSASCGVPEDLYRIQTTTLLRFAQLADLAYSAAVPQAEVEALTQASVLAIHAIPNDESAQVYVIVSRSSLSIVFRGTASIADVVADVNVFPTAWTLSSRHDFKDVAVHSGFYETYMTLRPKLLQVLDTLSYEGEMAARRSLNIVGHSLGGALAVLCTFDLNTRITSPRQDYTR
eukprot:gene11597-13699_t